MIVLFRFSSFYTFSPSYFYNFRFIPPGTDASSFFLTSFHFLLVQNLTSMFTPSHSNSSSSINASRLSCNSSWKYSVHSLSDINWIWDLCLVPVHKLFNTDHASTDLLKPNLLFIFTHILFQFSIFAVLILLVSSFLFFSLYLLLSCSF